MNKVTARRLALAACLAGACFPRSDLRAPSSELRPRTSSPSRWSTTISRRCCFTETCGFETWYTLEGTIKLSSHNNDLTIIRYRLTRTLNGPGGALALSEVGVDKAVTELTEDGFIETIHAAGHFNHSRVVPGYGAVELDVGSARFELTSAWDEILQDFIVTEEVLQQAGPRDRELTEADVEALCGYLG